MTSNAVLLYRFQHIITGFISGLPVAGWERFLGVSIRSVPAAVGLVVMLSVAAGEWVSIFSGGSIEERELLNKELDRETRDRA